MGSRPWWSRNGKGKDSEGEGKIGVHLLSGGIHLLSGGTHLISGGIHVPPGGAKTWSVRNHEKRRVFETFFTVSFFVFLLKKIKTKKINMI